MAGDPEQRRRGRWRRRLSWLPGLLLLAAVVVAASRFGEGERFARLLRRAQPAWLLAAALAQAATYACAAAVWQRVLGRAGFPRPLRSLVPLAVARLSVDQVVPTGGIGGRFLVVRALRRRGVPASVAIAALVVDLVTLYAAFAAGVVVSLAVLWRLGRLDRLIFTLAGLFAVVAVVLPTTALRLGRRRDGPPWWAHRLPRLAVLLHPIAQAPERLLRDPGLLTGAAALQLAVFLLDAATLGAMLCAIGSPAPAAVVFTGFVMAQAAAVVVLTPGGLGSFEAAAVALLALLGVPVEAALTATLLTRGFTYWLPMLPGLWISRREIHHSARVPPPELVEG